MGASLPYLQRQVERRLTDLTILGNLGTLPWWWERPKEIPPAARDQQVGQACAGRLITVCRDFFGANLPTACRTCPGPKAGVESATKAR